MARVKYLAVLLVRKARLTSASARMIFLFVFSLVGTSWAQQVANGLISSGQTYVMNDQGETIQEYGIGQVVYVVIDAKQDKKRKDFYRITFDPTNLKGDGWVLKDKVKLMTAYHSIDGKEPKEYEHKAEPLPTQSERSSGTSVASSGSSEASSFLEELIRRDEQKPELRPVTAEPPPAKTPPVKASGKNPLENDLEFLFQEEGEFKNTFKEAKAEVQKDMQKKFAISKFTSGTDSFANQILDQFAGKLQKNVKATTVARVGFVANLEDASGVSGVAIAPDLSGVFFGQMSPKIGDARLLKIKFYDKSLKQFTFEKVAKIPLTNPTPTVEKLANDCYHFISK